MPPVIIQFLDVAFLVGIILGLRYRRQQDEVWCFTIYIFMVLATDILITSFPEIFWTRPTYFAKEIVLHVAAAATAVNLAFLVTRAFPRARRAANLVLAFIVACDLYTWAVLAPTFNADEFAGRALPLMCVAELWLFGAVLAVSSWYQLPLRPLYRTIALGSCLYSVVNGVVYAVWWLEWSHAPKDPVSLGNYAWLGMLGVCAWVGTTAIWLAGVWLGPASDDPALTPAASSAR